MVTNDVGVPPQRPPIDNRARPHYSPSSPLLVHAQPACSFRSRLPQRTVASSGRTEKSPSWKRKDASNNQRNSQICIYTYRYITGSRRAPGDGSVYVVFQSSILANPRSEPDRQLSSADRAPAFVASSSTLTSATRGSASVTTSVISEISENGEGNSWRGKLAVRRLSSAEDTVVSFSLARRGVRWTL